jgi:hypothetical protein
VEKWRSLGLDYGLEGVPPPDGDAVSRARAALLGIR